MAEATGILTRLEERPSGWKGSMWSLCRAIGVTGGLLICSVWLAALLTIAGFAAYLILP